MGLFNLYKPREYNHRYIYYDPKKEAQKEREKTQEAAAGEYRPTIRRGTFREMAEKNRNSRVQEMRKANIRLIFIVMALLAIAYFLLK